MNASREGDTGKVQSLIEGLVSSAVDKEVQGLKSKNGELLGKLDEMKGFRELGDPDSVRKQLKELERMRADAEAHDRGVDPSEVEKLAEERATRKFESHKAKWEETAAEANRKLEEAMVRADQAEQKLHRNSIRQAILREASDVWPDLQGEVVSRLAPLYKVDGEDPLTGEPLLLAIDPEKETVIPGSGYKGSLSPSEALEMLRESKGNRPWNSRGRAFFKSFATGTGTRPGEGEQSASADRVGKMTPREYEKWREGGG